MTTAPDKARQEGEGGEPRVLVNVLGHFDVWHGERDLTPPTGRPSELVQLLAVNGGRLHREQVIDALWPGDPVRVGLVRLRNVLSHCRTRTGPLIGRHRQVLVFVAPHRIDLAEFLRLSEDAIRNADHDPPKPSPEEPKPSCSTAANSSKTTHAEWAHDAQRHTEQRRQLLLEALAQASEQLGDPFTARLYRDGRHQ